MWDKLFKGKIATPLGMGGSTLQVRLAARGRVKCKALKCFGGQQGSRPICLLPPLAAASAHALPLPLPHGWPSLLQELSWRIIKGGEKLKRDPKLVVVLCG